ncbi:MAG: hypothetical protein FWD32_02865 [Firmicutes bacterium]|nr:hypothetical protein [Bacillota bacterium]
MKVEYQVYNPGGNTTALITTLDLTDAQQIAAGKLIMQKEKSVEQVGFVEKIDKNVCTFEMAGGAFCGNSCRCVVSMMLKDYGQSDSGVLINKMKIIGKADHAISSVTIKEKSLVKKYGYNPKLEKFVVEMNGSVVIVDEKFYDTSNYKETKERVKELFPKTPAILIAYFNRVENKIQTFFWIKEADTFVEETGSVSGSIAACLFLRQSGELKKKNFSAAIKQPSGEEYFISIEDGYIIVSGLTKYISAGSVEI